MDDYLPEPGARCTPSGTAGTRSTERQRRVCSCLEGWHASLGGPANKAPTASADALAMGRLRLQSYVGVVTIYTFAL